MTLDSIKVLLSHESSQTKSSAFPFILSIILFTEQFFFYFMSWMFFQSISPQSLSGAFSPSLCFTLNPLLVVAISHVLPSYFILTLPLIRPPISVVHSSLSLFILHYSHSSSCLDFILCCFHCLPTAYPPVPFFFLTASFTLFLLPLLFHSSIFMLH